MQNEVEVMRVIRVPPMGALVVHADGERYRQISDVRNEKSRQRLLAAIGELVSFAGGYDALVGAGVAPPLPALAAERDAQHSVHEGDEGLSRRQAAFLDELERNIGPRHAGDALTQSPVPEAPDGPSAAGINLVAEIDHILQRHLAADEALSRRIVHLRQLPGQLLQIVVDGKVYEQPSDIEDEGVKRALKRALLEWEAR